MKQGLLRPGARRWLLAISWGLVWVWGLPSGARDPSAAGTAAASAVAASVPRSATGPAAALFAQRQALQAQLSASVFGEPLVLSSREGDDRIEGDVYAEVAHPFAAVAATMRSAAGVCEVLALHLNVRACLPTAGADGEGLRLLVGPKRAGAQSANYPMAYTLRSNASDAGYLQVNLSAAQGPLGTRDYRLVFEAVPLAGGRSFVHVGYAYGYGTLARLAMGGYLATAGRAKVGFTVLERDAQQRPVYVGGERAALERNVMRYHLALRAHLSVAPGAGAPTLLARQRAWFALTERHAEQLHEYSLAEYLREKRKDGEGGEVGEGGSAGK